ncbi:SusD/RagB family nutrient-binding outer membrane lipoprotein [Flavobacterium sp. AC]|uniref:SusD/RagB family nutrient-binding outer membrane lipoprotein n=1 Tax=Flavobacterium azizsancarii TaxID=2961580 RepID=A0ABT4W847_9FLAO|nr:SusD/RagB family nutrient-binding outer membrane lipoprotein [Flavobacterium azizsancarii]MDA6068736.1 SusD/RagB family nutrient-binding outer membrane lipoprotein [Flavobacterium azizsancarii]
MKNIKITITALMALFLFQSCSEDKMDDINKNVNNPADIVSRLIITNVMVNSAFTVTGSDASFYGGIYSELNAGNHNQMYNAQIRRNDPTLASTYSNGWDNLYEQLRTLAIIIDKCSTGEEKGNYQTLGIAQILTAYNLAVLTDLYGDVPYTEAGKPGVIYQPKVDKQEIIYADVFKRLNEGIANLKTTTTYPSLGNQDVIYEGNSAKWIKAANGLLARYTMRLSLRKADYQGVINYVNASFADVDDELRLVNTSVPNPYARFQLDRRAISLAKSFYDTMVANGTADARTDAFFTKIEGEVVPFDNSKADIEGQDIYSISALISEQNPIYLLSYHELLFLKAEAQARLGLPEAQATMNAAITAAYTKKQVVKFTAAQAQTYIASIPTLTGNALLKKIMVEKHISFYENEGVESYNDIRRLQAMGNGDFIPMVNPKPELFPQRFAYGLSDVSTNANIKELFGDGTYVYKEKVWWAGGTR